MKTAHILLVEDNEGDILLTTDALKDRKFINNISVVKNGKQAIDFVFQQGEYANVELPDLILLDVNLPLKNGHEVLQVIKSNKKTRKIPVIMLTTSSSERDKDLSYRNQANCYITKPVEMDEFIEAISTIEEIWIQVAIIPDTTAA